MVRINQDISARLVDAGFTFAVCRNYGFDLKEEANCVIPWDMKINKIERLIINTKEIAKLYMMLSTLCIRHDGTRYNN